MNYFLKAVGITIFLGIMIATGLGFVFEISEAAWMSIGAGTGLALLYVLTGFISFYFALKLSEKKFTRTVVISIFSRLILISVAIVVVFKFMAFEKVLFLISLFVWFFVFQLWEVISFNKLTLKGIYNL